MKKIFILMLAISMIFGAPPLIVSARVDMNFDGDGTEIDPFRITDAQKLALLAALVNEGNPYYNAAHYYLTKDIDLSDYATGTSFNDGNGWISIGVDADNAFKGYFDGGGHTIKGLAIAGLFGSNSGVIQNLGITESMVVGSDAVGTIACLNEGTIRNCYNAGYIWIGWNGDNTYAGGIVGINAGLVSGCYNSGEVTAIGQGGGIAGNNIGTISDCYNIGNVEAWLSAGGISGDHKGDKISNCYNAGYVGLNFAVDGSYIPGAGGIIGGDEVYDPDFIVSGSIENCYTFDGHYDNSYGTILTDAQLQTRSSFKNWDFDEIWNIDEGNSFPYLKAFRSPFETEMSIENIKLLYPSRPSDNIIMITLSRPLFGKKLILAVYDDGEFVTLTYPEIRYPAQNIFTVSYWGTLPSSATIKVFVWDDLSNMRPLCPAKTMKYENGDLVIAD